MLNFKNDFRNKTQREILYPRCDKEIHNEQHLFDRCNQLEDLYRKYKIKSYKEIFGSKMKMDRLQEIVEFIKKIGLE